MSLPTTPWGRLWRPSHPFTNKGNHQWRRMRTGAKVSPKHRVFQLLQRTRSHTGAAQQQGHWGWGALVPSNSRALSLLTLSLSFQRKKHPSFKDRLTVDRGDGGHAPTLGTTWCEEPTAQTCAWDSPLHLSSFNSTVYNPNLLLCQRQWLLSYPVNQTV